MSDFRQYLEALEKAAQLVHVTKKVSPELGSQCTFANRSDTDSDSRAGHPTHFGIRLDFSLPTSYGHYAFNGDIWSGTRSVLEDLVADEEAGVLALAPCDLVPASPRVRSSEPPSTQDKPARPHRTPGASTEPTSNRDELSAWRAFPSSFKSAIVSP